MPLVHSVDMSADMLGQRVRATGTRQHRHGSVALTLCWPASSTGTSRRHGTKMPHSMSAENHPVTCSATARSMFYCIFSQNGQQLVCSIKCCNLTQPIDTKRPHHSHQNDFGKMFLWSSNTQDGYRACINSLQYIKGAYCPTYLIFSNI